MSPDRRPGSRVAGYRIVRAIGRGAQGVVYLARRPGSTAPVALKLVDLGVDVAGGVADPDAAAEFLRRADAMRRLDHPSIAAVSAAGIDGGTGWLAMTAVLGVPLDRYTRPARRLPEAVVVDIGVAIARALAHAHRHGVVHRDLKPGNVIVRWPGGDVTLVDFGLARDAGSGRTSTGLLPGTPAYLSPEQLAGAMPTAASDLYALGATLYELLAGRLPHDAPSLGELLRSVAGAEVPPLGRLNPEVPAPLAHLVAGLLDRDPARRGADAQVVADALQRVRSLLPAASAAEPAAASEPTAPGGAKSR